MSADIADRHVGVACWQRIGDDGRDAVVAKDGIAVNRVDFFAVGDVLIPVVRVKNDDCRLFVSVLRMRVGNTASNKQQD